MPTRMENELNWRHGAPQLLAAREAFWRGAATSPIERSVDA